MSDTNTLEAPPAEPVPAPSPREAKREQFRQAKSIHGGLLNMSVAAMGVKLSRLPLPTRRLREKVYRTIYGDKYKALDESELDRPLGDFPSLNALFTRGVRSECRPVSTANSELVSPCDSTVQDVGTLAGETLLTVKGIRYTVDSLLPGMDTSDFHDGKFSIQFLSPADCHRIFAPDDGTLKELVHVPGTRLLVHPPFQRAEFPVFTLNERVILRLNTKNFGPCVLVMVAGWGVGNITFPFDTTLRMRGPLRTKKRQVTRQQFEPGRSVSRGEWLSTFELGSTVIVLTTGDANLEPLIERDQPLRYGEPIFRSEATTASREGNLQ